MKQAIVFLNKADLTMNRSSCFKPSASVASTTFLSRRQWLLSGMAASATAVLLAAKPLRLGYVQQSNAVSIQALGAFDALRIFLQASAHSR